VIHDLELDRVRDAPSEELLQTLRRVLRNAEIAWMTNPTTASRRLCRRR
jgi:hypothetical protein